MIRSILISLLLIMPMKVIAAKYDEDATLRNSGPIYLHIYDNGKVAVGLTSKRYENM